MTKNSKIIAVVLAVVIVGGVLVFLKNNSQEESTPVTQIPQMSAMPSMTSTPSTATQSASASAQEGTTKDFTITGSNYAFTPNMITVNQGDTVNVTFKSSGGLHDFVIDEFNAKTKTISGETQTTVQFVADKKGTFQFYCSVDHHRQMGMVGTLIVK